MDDIMELAKNAALQQELMRSMRMNNGVSTVFVENLLDSPEYCNLRDNYNGILREIKKKITDLTIRDLKTHLANSLVEYCRMEQRLNDAKLI
jgi:hypothetical protein